MHKTDGINVIFPEELKDRLPSELHQRVEDVLKQDPRAAYNKKPDYVYGMRFLDYDIRFVVENETLIVKDIVEIIEDDYKKIK